MTETKLPDELEEQAMLYALGLMPPNDRKTLMAKLQGEANFLRQTVVAYQAVDAALASTVVPRAPRPILRDRLLEKIAHEDARETAQFQVAADVLISNVAPVSPSASLKERLMARIEGHAEVQLDLQHAPTGLRRSPIADSTDRRRARAWRHFFLTVYASLRLCWKAGENLLRACLVSPARADGLKETATKNPLQGLTFIKEREGVWRQIEPGVMVKVLALDTTSRRTTALLRFSPGTRYAPHRHTEVEELLVLQGGCSIAGRAMAVGDYHRAEAGTEHYDTSTDEGCLLLVISSPMNQLLSE